ncbi:P-type DNA transfer ATPase VirB11 [Caulobacter sp. 73W]|uniref:P-type DNA transfer ATPase VirB11 n=1 Tax=Caulobacter sp. 73W TaxID=3161137 RepID=A0AB39KRD3_9CAUL
MSGVLDHHLAPLSPFLDDPAVREVVVNRPGEIGVETAEGWRWVEDGRLTSPWLMTLARAAAAVTGQDVGSEAPICSTSLPRGARCQIVLPPAAGEVTLCIRRPMGEAPDLHVMAREGLFDIAADAALFMGPEQKLAALKASGDWASFLALAVRLRKTILVSGATGSGKTTLARALAAKIPDGERLVTIEDARELELAHRNLVRLTWAREGQGRASLGPGDLLACALRLRPDRILLGEVRDGASAFHLLRNIASGHPGSIATIHAGSCALALDQLALLVRETPAGRDLPSDEVRALLSGLIDILVQMDRVDGRFRVVEVRHGGALKPALAA